MKKEDFKAALRARFRAGKGKIIKLVYITKIIRPFKIRLT